MKMLVLSLLLLSLSTSAEVRSITQSATHLQGVPISGTAPTSTQVLTFNGTQWAPAAGGGGGGGEANTASNLGAGEGVFAAKVGVDLRFKSLVQGTNISLSSTGTEVQIDGASYTGNNLGTGEPIFDGVSLLAFQFKSLKAGSGITLTSSSDEILIESTGGSGASTSLDNLTTTNINQDLNPDTDVTESLGSPANRWLTLYAADLRDAGTNVSYNVATREIFDSSGVIAIDGSGRELFDSFGGSALVFNDSADIFFLKNMVPNDDVTQNIGSSSKRVQTLSVVNVQNDGGSNNISFNDGIDLKDNKSLRFYDSGNNFYAELLAPSSLAANYSLTLPPEDGNSGEVLTTDGSGALTWEVVGGTGTVTDVALALPSIFSVSGSPVTTTGTLTGSLTTQVANTIFAGPASGADATPTFRSLVALDIPNLSAAKITSGQGTLSTSTTGVTVGTGSNSLLSNATVDVQTASGSQPGLLSSTDWTTFNGKQASGLAALKANNLSDLASASTARTNLSLVPGTDVQAFDADLLALAGLTSAADKVPYFTGSGTAAVADFTSAGRALVDDASASAQRTTLGVGTGDSPAFAGLSLTGAETITSASANSLAVGPNGTTTPIFQVDSSTASAVAGLKLTGAASGTGVTLATQSSSTNEPLTVSSKGTSILHLASSGLGSITFDTNGSTRATLTSASSSFTPGTSGTAGTTRFGYTSAADTALTAGAEAVSVQFDMASTRQHGSNTAISLQRDMVIRPSTHSFVSSGGVITDATALSISSGPLGGTNATITNSHAIRTIATAVTNVTNSYGATINAMSGATNNYAAQFIGGNVGIGLAAPTALLHTDAGTATASAHKFTANATTGRASTDGVDFGIDTSGNGEIRQREALDTIFYTNNAEVLRFLSAGNMVVPTTVTAGGTTGAQTINKISGTVNFAAVASTLVVTDSLVTANSIVMAVLRTNDATCRLANVVPASGSFTINMTGTCTAETSVGFFVIN